MKIEKIEKLVANFHDKGEYAIHLRSLNQALNHGVVLQKVHRAFRCNHIAWLKPYIDMNIELKKKAKTISKKIS